MAKQAVILHIDSPGSREQRLGRILDFFGVPWKAVDISRLEEMAGNLAEYAAFGSAQAVADALNKQRGCPEAFRPTAFYAYAGDERGPCSGSLGSLFGNPNVSLKEAPSGKLSFHISEASADLAGPMAGLRFSVQLRSEDAILAGVTGEGSTLATLASVGVDPVFVQIQRKGAPIFFCTSSQIVDVDARVSRGFYDVKDHCCSVIPLVMFIKFMFAEIAWRPQERGACLIIDDPLLRSKYGFCNFPKLRDLMRQHGFTTNIAFIPWNWRRTSLSEGDFFTKESEFFSVSIHGCDHTAGEFGTTSPDMLHATARLAQSRMRSHQARTGVRHDSIMVFPQGIFSSMCPPVLQSHEFLAAVNTEIVPVDSQNARTRIKDAWDVAITAYGGFPIFTRRYAFHGLENFAFDLLLGKPCFIVAHHDFFQDGGAGLIDLVEKIASLNCSVRWRTLGEVIRRACRRRATGIGTEEIEMYGGELLVSNPTDQSIEIRLCKKKGQDDLASAILCDERALKWTTEAEHLFFDQQILPHSERNFRIIYEERGVGSENPRRSLRFELSVATRRILCEFRDDYVLTNPFLSGSARHLKGLLSKAD